MRAALSAADEFADSLMVRADTAEREMLILEAQVVQLASMQSGEDGESDGNAETWSERSGDGASEAGLMKEGRCFSLQKTASWGRGQQTQEQQEFLLAVLRKRGEGGAVETKRLLPWHWLCMGAAAGMTATVAALMALRRGQREDDSPVSPRMYPLHATFGSERYRR